MFFSGFDCLVIIPVACAQVVQLQPGQDKELHIRRISVAIEDVAVVESNFDDCKVLKLAQMPEVNVEIANSGESVGGIGEPGLKTEKCNHLTSHLQLEKPLAADS